MRRDNKDLKWKKVKEAVRKRDKGCRLCKILTVKEMLILKRKAGRLLNFLDCAHIFPVGKYPILVYEKKNIVLMNRFSHHLLDDYKNPLTGDLLTKEEHTEWWIRIIGEKLYSELEILSKRSAVNESQSG